MNRTTVSINGKRHTVYTLPTTMQMLAGLKAWGYAKTTSEAIRHAIREAWERQAQVAGVLKLEE